MNPIPMPVVEGLLVIIFIMLSVVLSYNFRSFKLNELLNVQDKQTLYLIIFWIVLNCSLVGYGVAKLHVFSIYWGIFGGIVLAGILLIISIKLSKIELNV